MPYAPVGIMAETIRLEVGGMTCDGCSNRVKSALEDLPGVITATVSHQGGSAEVSHEGATSEELGDAVRSVGYTVDGRGEEFHWKDKAVWRQSANNTKWCLIGCSICLLYTSPSPRDMRRSRMPSSA